MCHLSGAANSVKRAPGLQVESAPHRELSIFGDLQVTSQHCLGLKNQANHLGPLIRSMNLSATGSTNVKPQPSGFFARAH
jgi:hypothetical protein